MPFRRAPREPTVTLFYVTDLHGSDVTFRKFLNAANAYRVGYHVELETDEASALAADEEAREALFTRLVQKRLADWIALAEERLAGTGVRLYVTGGNDDSEEMLEPLVDAGS